MPGSSWSTEPMRVLTILAALVLTLGLTTSCAEPDADKQGDSRSRHLREDCPSYSPPPEGQAVMVLCELHGRLPLDSVRPGQPSATP